MANILITGGTGLVGKHLCKALTERGHNINLLSRSSNNDLGINTYLWDIKRGQIDAEAVNKADYIIHLAGANIGQGRWTEKRKQEIIQSRTQSGELIFNALDPKNNQLKAFISSSATGYYGSSTTDKIFTEDHPPANDFLGLVCQKWEKTADAFQNIGIRTVKIRTAVVFTESGGALAKMSIPISMGVGSPVGSGQQYIPWIHLDDLVGIYLKAIEDNEMIGAYNAVAPEHLTNTELTQRIAKKLNKKLWLPNVPAFLLKLLLGEMSVIVLEGSRISSDKIRSTGYSFIHSNYE